TCAPRRSAPKRPPPPTGERLRRQPPAGDWRPRWSKTAPMWRRSRAPRTQKPPALIRAGRRARLPRAASLRLPAPFVEHGLQKFALARGQTARARPRAPPRSSNAGPGPSGGSEKLRLRARLEPPDARLEAG